MECDELRIPVYRLPRPSRRYCKPILHEDNKEMPIITVTLECFE